MKALFGILGLFAFLQLATGSVLIRRTFIFKRLTKAPSGLLAIQLQLKKFMTFRILKGRPWTLQPNNGCWMESELSETKRILESSWAISSFEMTRVKRSLLVRSIPKLFLVSVEKEQQSPERFLKWRSRVAARSRQTSIALQPFGFQFREFFRSLSLTASSIFAMESHQSSNSLTF